MQHIEHLQHHGLRVSGTTGEAAAKPREIRPSVAAQTHQLTIECHSMVAQRSIDRRQLRELG